MHFMLQGSLLKQLAIANKSVGGGVVVVLAERDKEEMELDIAKLEFDFMGTSVICRSGSPLILADLKKVSLTLYSFTPTTTTDLAFVSLEGSILISYLSLSFIWLQFRIFRLSYIFSYAGLSFKSTCYHCIGI